MNYLIVDLNITLNGHKFGFVQETLNHLEKIGEQAHEFHFLVNVPLKKSKLPHIHVHLVEPSYQAKFQRLKGISKYQEQWKYIVLKASQQGISEAILMELDIYQAAIGLDRSSDFNISGIWFRPYFRQKPVGLSLLRKGLFFIKRLQKKLLLRSTLRNDRLQKVFVLNDQKTVDYLNQKYRNRFAYLPDPVFEHSCTQNLDIRKKYKIDDQTAILLIFGFIDDRKNVLNILKALENLPRKNQQKICLLIIGKAAEEYQPVLNKALENHKSEVGILRIDDFVDNCEMEAIFAQSDLILRMNVNYFASSGIIGIAAKYNKPSIVSDYGILAELTEKYDLGQLVDPLKPKEISALVSDFLSQPQNWKIDGQPYYQDHNTMAFVNTLLNL